MKAKIWNFKIFLACFIGYFTIGLIVSYYLNTVTSWSVFFGFDTPRVFFDLTWRDTFHGRVTVHPLFVLLGQPLTIIINILFNNYVISCLFLEAILGSVSVILLYKCFQKLKINKLITNLLIVIFAFSWSQIAFTAAVETYIFAQFYLLLMWYFVITKMDQKLMLKDYGILVLLGVGSIAITLTNFMQFIIATFFLILCNKNIKKSFFKYCATGAMVILVAFFLAAVQNKIWPTAPNFLIQNIKDFATHSSEETIYMSRTINAQSFLNFFQACFGQNFHVYNLMIFEGLNFKPSIVTDVFALVITALFLISNIYFMIKTKFAWQKHKIYYALIVTFLGNLALHLIYGNTGVYLYLAHFAFIILLLWGYILNYFDKWFKIASVKYKWLYIIIGIITIALAFRGAILMILKLFSHYAKIETINYWPIVILSLALISFIALWIMSKRLNKK